MKRLYKKGGKKVVKQLKTGCGCVSEIDQLRAREEQLERHIAELNSRDFAQEVFTLEAEIDELCAQVGEIADLLDDFGTSHPSDVIRYKCAERLRNLSRYGLFLVKRERR